MKALRFVLVLAARESRAAWPRLALPTLAVAVGVAALVAINSFTDNLLVAVRGQARSLLGADLAFSSGAPFSPRAEAQLAAVLASPAVRGEVTRLSRVTSFAAMAYAPGSAAARLVQVAAVEPGYPFYGAIETDPRGLWERLADEGGLLADAALLSALAVRVGDDIALGEARFRILGSVVSVPGDVSIRAAFGPRAFIPARRLAETHLLGFGSRARYEAFARLPEGVDAQRLAEQLRAPLSAERVTLRTVSDDQTRLNETLARLGRYLGLVALVALLLGGLGVASAVHVFVKRKIETVAVLRCLGASGRLLLAAYLVQAAALGLLGSLLGAALGLATELFLPGLLGEFLPVDVGIAPSWPAVASGLGLGLWATIAFAALPLLAVRRVSPLVVLRRAVEEAPAGRDPARLLATAALGASIVGVAVLEAGRVLTGLAFSAGIGAALAALWLAAFGLVRGVRRFFPRRLPYVWRQGLANLYRPANQTVAVVLALGFGAFLLGTLLLLQHNLLRDLRLGGGSDRANLAFFDIQPDQRAAVEAAIRSAGFQAWPAVPIVPMRIRAVKGKATSERLAVPGDAQAVRDRWALRREYRSTYRDHPTASELLVAGHWWNPGAGRHAETVPVSLEEGLARELGVKLGDAIDWDVQGITVSSRVQSLREVSWARFEPNFFAVFPEGPLADAPQSFVTLTRVDDARARGRLQRRLAEALPNVTSLDLSAVQQAVESILARVALAIRFMALFSLAAGGVVLAGAVASSRYQRVREGVLLRALGATRSQVRQVLLAEYASLGAMAALTALGLAGLAAWALMRFLFEARFTLPLPALLGLATGVVALTLLTGLLGSAEVYRRTPIDVLRSE